MISNVCHERRNQTGYVVCSKSYCLQIKIVFVCCVYSLSVCFLGHWQKGVAFTAPRKSDSLGVSIKDSLKWRRESEKSAKCEIR